MSDNDITEHFAERAAIAEHDGGLSRRVAEYQAARAKILQSNGPTKRETK